MMRRIMSSLGFVAFISGFAATSPAAAQQSVNLYLGGFIPHDLSDRDRDDVLFNNADFLLFDAKEFHGFTFGGEYLVGLGDYFDAGLGVGYYSESVPSVYRDLVNANGSEIQQDLKLRIVPMTATLRFLPLGHHDAITPYVGGGVGILNWKYTETGQFVDTDGNIFRDTFVGSDTTVGPLFLAGLRVPVGKVGFGFEYRYQSATGNLPLDQGFSGSKIDLGGHNYLFTVNIEF